VNKKQKQLLGREPSEEGEEKQFCHSSCADSQKKQPCFTFYLESFCGFQDVLYRGRNKMTQVN
jgi:hypothetical protein